MREPTRVTKLPPHPANRAATVYAVLGGLSALVAVAGVSGGSLAAIPGAFVMLGMSALFFWLGRYFKTSIRVVQINNLAYDLMTRGNLEQADAMLAPVAAGLTRGSPARAVDIQRGLIALHRGDPAAAIGLLTRALGARKALLTRRHEETQIPGAHALRAVAHAMLGNEAEAEADARAAESAVTRTPDTVARAMLARGILHARADRREALVETLRGLRTFKESLTPRERALVRAFERMTRSEKRSVYREPAPVVEERSAAGLAAWVEKIAPQAASFVIDAAPAGEPEPWNERPTAEGAARLARTRRDAQKAIPHARAGGGSVVALWLILIVMFLAIWQFLSPSGDPVGAPVDAGGDSLLDTLLGVAPPVIALLFAVAVARGLRAGTKEEATLRQISLLAAAGGTAEAITLARAAARTKLGAQAAAAQLVLAQLLEKRGEFHAAAVEAQAGITRANARGVKVAVSDILLPELIAARAFSLAADGELEESIAETNDLVESYPAFPYRARALLRIRIAQSLARRDFAAAAVLARTRTPELPIAVRDEVLCDLLVLWSEGRSGGDPGATAEEERARLIAALEDDRELAAWVDALAPGLGADVARKVRLAVEPDAESDDEPAVPGGLASMKV